MDKYAVVTEDEQVKTGSTEKNCPKCGKDISDPHLPARYCPNCGTEPWEKRPETK